MQQSDPKTTFLVFSGAAVAVFVGVVIAIAETWKSDQRKDQQGRGR